MSDNDEQEFLEAQQALKEAGFDEEEIYDTSHLELSDLKDVLLQISTDLGVSKMNVKEILDLKVGSIIALNKMAGEMTDILINKLPMARGEVVVLGETLHVRISEIIGVSEILDG
jgi:flagellar motor switch protein FliN/FliY